MGNQLVGIAPSQIYPVEYYLTDLPELAFDSSLGSTRFFKVALATYKEGLVVVKVFAIHDPTLPLKAYSDELNNIQKVLKNSTNCLPFQRTLLTDKAGLLIRQYVKYNLYDRISTRPFLNNIEKKWIAFQIMYAISEAHKSNICHGDIKLENLMITSWNWVFLTDFASFKPTYLPEDNPADFSYFFDTSRRRICYIAPERFVSTLNFDASYTTSTNILLPDDEVLKGDLTQAMDVFSIGCSLAELFTEGHPPFDLSQLLSYRVGDYSPWKVLEKIEETSIREMVRHMLQKNPDHRLSIEEYLEQQRDKAFPEYFYSFLKVYVQEFSTFTTSSSMLTSDDKISRLKKDMSNIIKLICDIDVEEDDDDDDPKSGRSNSDISTSGKNTQGLVIIVSLLTSNLRTLQQCKSKLHSLQMMQMLSKYVSSEIVLDRLLPFIMHFLHDSNARVRAMAIQTLTVTLSLVNTLPRSDVNVFPEYILPNLTQLTDDPAVSVRVQYAQNIALLAETALKFLEMSQLEDGENEQDISSNALINNESASDDPKMINSQLQHIQGSYDAELQALHEMIQQIVSTLLSDHDNIVKQTLLQNGITRLCIFFGRQKANDLLLSHMITFLNHQNDRHLRSAFFDSIVGVAAYIGWQSAPILKPLLQQGLSDFEESVVCKSVDTLTSLTELGLIQKNLLYDFLNDVASFLCHPNLWIRQASVGFICCAARMLNVVDVHCKVQPFIKPFIKRPIIQLNKELVLLSVLDDPVPRAVFDFIIRCSLMVQLLDQLNERQIIRSITRPGHPPAYNDINPGLKPIYRRLQADGLTDSIEDKLLAMKEYLLKLHHRNTQNELQNQPMSSPGVISLSDVPTQVNPRFATLNVYDSKESGGSTQARKQLRKKQTLDSQSVVMNAEWQHMFGSSTQRPQSPKLSRHSSPSSSPRTANSSSPVSSSTSQSQSVSKPMSTANIPETNNQLDVSQQKTSTDSSASTSKQQASPKQGHKNVIYRYAECKSELQELICRKRDQYVFDMRTKDVIDAATQHHPHDSGDLCLSSWHPSGKLVAHLHEHQAAVNRIKVIPNTHLFASCSNDGTVKIWDCGRMEAKSNVNRSRQTYNRQEGQIMCMAVCNSSQCIASASDACTIHVFHYETHNPKMAVSDTRILDPQEDGCVVDMNHLDSGSQLVLAYATVYGSIVGWDLRSPGNAWKMENNLRNGLITSFCIDPRHCWLVAGTSSGNIICWDLRFQLPISTLHHPSRSRIRRLLLHPSQESLVISAVQNNNEVNIWDMETNARHTTIWASHAPPLSHSEVNTNSTYAMYVASGGGNAHKSSYLLTAGSDMRIRHWDLQNPVKSYIVAKAAADPTAPFNNSTTYRTQFIDGTNVIQEMYGRPAGTPTSNQAPEETPRRGPDMPPKGHYDTISDLTVMQTSQNLLLSSSWDGVIKVWK